MSYTFDLPDFKSFLHSRNEKYRVDGLIFWQNRIPLPVDLFNRMFGEAEFFFVLYLDHIMAALISVGNTKEVFGKAIDFGSLPANEVSPLSHAAAIGFERILSEKQVFRRIAAHLSGLLGIEDYRPDGGRLASVICHQGKKYTRLYLPEQFREVLSDHNPVSLTYIGTDNTDMFGNVIADHYDIYRSGFSDALAIIFNLLVEFRLICGGASSSLQRISLSVEEVAGVRVEVKKTRDGSLWEPDYDGDHMLRINPEHPFFLAAAKNGNMLLLNELLYALGKFEYSQFSDSQRKLLENMRQEISRDLWIRHDK